MSARAIKRGDIVVMTREGIEMGLDGAAQARTGVVTRVMEGNGWRYLQVLRMAAKGPETFHPAIWQKRRVNKVNNLCITSACTKT